MIGHNIAKLRIVKQEPRKETLVMHGKAFLQLINTIVREYGVYQDGTLSVDIDSLTHIDKKLLLSHLLEASDYEWACENPVRVEEVFGEHYKVLERLISDCADQIYREDMRDHGCVAHYRRDNGECYWVRR